MKAFVSPVLHVDLSTGRTWREERSLADVRKYLGARGGNASLFWDQARTGVDALDPENLLIFGVGSLTGTNTPLSGRTTVTTKSPATHLSLKCNMGGGWGAALRSAGYDHLIIHGASPKPVYLRIADNVVEIRPADLLWGKDVRETTRLLTKAEDRAEVACIGPAGENLVKIAAIMGSTYNAAGRGGAGAVMGSKKLKAIVATGHQPVRVADSARLQELVQQVRQRVADAIPSKQKYMYGTAASLAALNELRALPTRNFQRGYFPEANRITGQYLVEQDYLKRRVACFSCPTACHRYTEIHQGPYAGTYSGGPEYETLAALGAGTGSSDIEAILKGNELCNIYGLDTISTGSAIQFLMECQQRGVLSPEQTGGLNLEWGSAGAMLALIRMIAYREGPGAMLAEGVRQAARVIGQGSEKWAIESKGLEQSRVETRSAKAYALAFAVNPRGPDHLHCQPIAEFGFRPAGVELIGQLTGNVRYANPYTTDKRAEIVVWHEDFYAAGDALGLCSFATTADFTITPELAAGLFSAMVGEEIGADELLRTGRRILTLEKCFNVREGATRADDRLPWRLMHEESPDRQGAINSREEMDHMLDEYYALHGWDPATSYPTAATLRELGLDQVTEELARQGKLK
jgi:aldehyde:ferredoxin oxidoreductase